MYKVTQKNKNKIVLLPVFQEDGMDAALLLTLDQRKVSARIRFYSQFNHSGALIWQTLWSNTEAKRSNPMFFWFNIALSLVLAFRRCMLLLWTRVGTRPTLELSKPLFLTQLSPGWVSLPSALCSCMKPQVTRGIAKTQGFPQDRALEQDDIWSSFRSKPLNDSKHAQGQGECRTAYSSGSAVCSFNLAGNDCGIRVIPACPSLQIHWPVLEVHSPQQRAVNVLRGCYLYRIFIKVMAQSLHKDNIQNMQHTYITQVYKWF